MQFIQSFAQKLFYVSCFMALFWACSEREFTSAPSAKLSFSTDTLSFDTVFSTIGSATRYFKIHNRNSKYVNVSSIRLGNGLDSYFRLNINGIKTNYLKDVEIPPNDSLFVFVEVTVDPRQSNTPMQVTDSVLFSTNGNLQDVKLMAYGQDVHLINGQVISKSQVWENDKPYLVQNSVLIDTLTTLLIKPGVRVHFSHNSSMYIQGRLLVEGTKQDSVVFTSMRLEQLYDDVPGLWQGIWFMAGSYDNSLEYAQVKNAVVGLRVDTTMNTGKPTLSLHNTRVEHHTAVGLYAQGAQVQATNTIFGDCGVYAVSLQVGGEYVFSHCTIGNYWAYGGRETPALLLRNYYIDANEQVNLRPITQADFLNCIVYGNRENELLVDKHEEALLNFTFDHCLLRIDPELGYQDLPQLTHCIINEQPLFADLSTYDYRLQAESPAKDTGNRAHVDALPTRLTTDMDGKLRTADSNPDLGALEYEELEEEPASNK